MTLRRGETFSSCLIPQEAGLMCGAKKLLRVAPITVSVDAPIGQPHIFYKTGSAARLQCISNLQASGVL